jgi:hypothetical protein
MGRFAKRLIIGFAAALAVAGGAFADWLLDDMEGGSSEHKLGYYWYYYVADDERKGEKKASEAEGYKHIITNAGPGDEYGAFTFSPNAGTGRTGASAAMVYTNLDYANTYDCTPEIVGTDTIKCEFYPTIGMGMSLTASDTTKYGADFNNVTAVEFWMKATDVDTVIFKVETIENAVVGGIYGPTNIGAGWWPDNKNDLPGNYDRNPSNAWMKKIHPTDAWAKYTVNIANATGVTTEGAKIDKATAPGTAGDLKQDGWWGYSFTFKKENATKIAWQINNDKNTKKTGALYIDDIRLMGTFDYIPKDECRDCDGKTLPAGTKMLISDFEGSADNPGALLKNTLGYYWYPYTDAKARTDGSVASAIRGTGVWVEDPNTGEDVLNAVGNGNGGNGIYAPYVLGPSPFEQDKDGKKQNLTAFAGVGTNLFDTSSYEYTNATGATGIYFEYKTTDVDFLSVEVSDKLDVDKAGPDGDNDDGQVWYRKVKGSATWTGAIINFSDLVLPKWIKAGDRRYGVPLKLSELAKIQFKYVGTKPGSISIDNVYLLGIASTGSGVKLAGSKAMASGLRVSYSRGNVGVNWNTASQVASGKVQLVNTKGRVVASAPIASAAGRVTANLGAGKIPTGMYFVRVNAKDASGKKLVQQAPISIVK